MSEPLLVQAWLRGLAKLIKANMLDAFDLDTVVVYGFPRGREADSVRGTCYFPRGKNGAPRRCVIFIHPAEFEDPAMVARTLIHEMVHAIFPETEGHGERYRSRATAIGLTGDLFDTPTAKLQAEIGDMLAVLPPMPSDPLSRTGSGKTQTTRNLLYVCSCNVKIRCASKDLMAQCNRCNTRFERSV